MKDPAASSARVAPRRADRPRPASEARAPIAGRMTVTGRVLGPDGKPAAGVPVDIIGAPRTPEAGTDVRADALRRARPGRDRRRRPLPHRGVAHLVVSRSPTSTPWPAPPGPAPASAAWSSTPMPSSPRPRSTSSPSRSSAAGWSTSTASRPPGSRSRSTRSMATPPGRGGRFDSPGLGRRLSLVRLARGAPRLAEGRHHRRPGPVHLHRHRPRPLRLAVRPRPALRPAAIRPPGRRSRRRQGGHAGPPSVDDHRGPRAGRRHRPADPRRRDLRAGPASAMFGAMVTTRFRADDQGRFRINPYAGDYFRMRAIPAEGQPYLARRGRVRVDQGRGQEGDRPQAPPRRADPRQGDRSRGPAGRCAGASVQFFAMKRPGDIVTARGDRGQPRRTARSGSPSRPARDT